MSTELVSATGCGCCGGGSEYCPDYCVDPSAATSQNLTVQFAGVGTISCSGGSCANYNTTPFYSLTSLGGCTWLGTGEVCSSISALLTLTIQVVDATHVKWHLEISESTGGPLSPRAVLESASILLTAGKFPCSNTYALSYIAGSSSNDGTCDWSGSSGTLN